MTLVTFLKHYLIDAIVELIKSKRAATIFQELSKAVNAETLPNGKDKIIISLSIPALADVMDNGYEVDKIHQ